MIRLAKWLALAILAIAIIVSFQYLSHKTPEPSNKPLIPTYVVTETPGSPLP